MLPGLVMFLFMSLLLLPVIIGELLMMATFAMFLAIPCLVLCIPIPVRNTIFLVPLLRFPAIVYMMVRATSMKICD